MTRVVPDEVREDIQNALWAKADSLKWTALPDSVRASCYQQWTNDPAIGGVLSHYMDPRKVRVYIKDSLLKPYFGARATYDVSAVLSVLREPKEVPTEHFVKPQGVRLLDGRTVCWGNSRDWKLILMACFERAALATGAAHAVLLLEGGRTVDPARRALIESAGSKLGIGRVVWVDEI